MNTPCHKCQGYCVLEPVPWTPISENRVQTRCVNCGFVLFHPYKEVYHVYNHEVK